MSRADTRPKLFLCDYDCMADDQFIRAMDEAETLMKTGQIDAALEQLHIARREYLDMSNELYHCRLAPGQQKQ